VTDDPTTFAGEVFDAADWPPIPAPRAWRFPRQDSVRDQLESVAERVGGTVARWIRGEGERPTLAEVRGARRIAVELGCCDADDWMAP
jgi:hypothetical protein